MSAPSDDTGFTDPLRYAPPWARKASPDRHETAPSVAPGPTDDLPAHDLPVDDKQIVDVPVDRTPTDDPIVAAPATSRRDVCRAEISGREVFGPETSGPVVDEVGPEVILGVRFGGATRTVAQDLDPIDARAAEQATRPADVASRPTPGRIVPPTVGAEPVAHGGPNVPPPTADEPGGAESSGAAPVRARPSAEPEGSGEPRLPAVWLVMETEPVRTDPPRVAPPPLVDSPAMVPSPGDPGGFGWLRPRPFEGDVAMRELTRRLALDPHGVPEPPRPNRRRRPWRGAMVLAALCGASGAVALALVTVLYPAAGTVPSDTAGTVGESGGPVLASAKADRALMAGLERAAPVRLVLVEQRRAARGQEVSLGVTLTRGLGEGSLVLSGLAPGSRLTVGMPMGPTGWRVPLGELGRAALVPPETYAGTMEIGLELRRPDDTIGDRSSMRITWAGALITPVAGVSAGGNAGAASVTPVGLRGTTPIAATDPVQARGPSVPLVDAEEIAILLDRGKAFLARGDLAAARMLLRRAAEAGDAPAALLLGSTFDPVALEQLQMLGAVADSTQARRWYQRAAELGSADATRKLESLARAP